ncbi:macrophage mannose receptor 1-like [Argopecten irradians]|uniref:macrophage mannose receptor 1-like n=1 Tax=Argopecten irradians TaxID=31199 RepID=UPI003721F6C3
MGAKLVEIKTDEESRFLYKHLSSRIGHQKYSDRKLLIYTGRKRRADGAWVFASSGEKVDTSLRTWADNEPHGGKQTCGCTKLSNGLLMSDCFCTGYSLNYICEKMPRPIMTTGIPMSTVNTGTGSKACKTGWITSPEKCYYVSTLSEKTNWNDANTRCKALGANLVEIATDEEGVFLLDRLPSWVGDDVIYTGRRRTSDDVWIFSSNETNVDTSKRSWAIAEPSGGSQQCGCTSAPTGFLMVDCYCTGFEVFFICEIRRN